MKLSQYSHHRLMGTFEKWEVVTEYVSPFYNYLVFGLSPGSFFTSVMANDFAGAIQNSHPANTITALKPLTSWMVECMPAVSHGSWGAVQNWLKLTPETRRSILENHNLIFTAKEETWQALAAPTHETAQYYAVLS
jgi:hypothetical protein